MTYQEIIDLINGNLADLSDIHPDEHREALIAVLDFAKESFENVGEQINPIEIAADFYIQMVDQNDNNPTVAGINVGSVQVLDNSLVNDTRLKVNFQNEVNGSYFVVLTNESIASGSGGWNNDNDIILTMKNPLPGSLEVLLREVGASIQSLKVHVTIIKYQN